MTHPAGVDCCVGDVPAPLSAPPSAGAPGVITHAATSSEDDAGGTGAAAGAAAAVAADGGSARQAPSACEGEGGGIEPRALEDGIELDARLTAASLASLSVRASARSASTCTSSWRTMPDVSSSVGSPAGRRGQELAFLGSRGCHAAGGAGGTGARIQRATLECSVAVLSLHIWGEAAMRGGGGPRRPFSSLSSQANCTWRGSTLSGGVVFAGCDGVVLGGQEGRADGGEGAKRRGGGSSSAGSDSEERCSCPPNSSRGSRCSSRSEPPLSSSSSSDGLAARTGAACLFFGLRPLTTMKPRLGTPQETTIGGATAACTGNLAVADLGRDFERRTFRSEAFAPKRRVRNPDMLGWRDGLPRATAIVGETVPTRHRDTRKTSKLQPCYLAGVGGEQAPDARDQRRGCPDVVISSKRSIITVIKGEAAVSIVVIAKASRHRAMDESSYGPAPLWARHRARPSCAASRTASCLSSRRLQSPAG